MNELISIIEGAAPTIASALVPGPLSGPIGSLAGVAIAHLAEGLGLPHPAEPADIINALSNLTSPTVKDAVLSRAEANFQKTLAPVLPAVQDTSAPATTPAEPLVSTHHGVTMDIDCLHDAVDSFRMARQQGHQPPGVRASPHRVDGSSGRRGYADRNDHNGVEVCQRNESEHYRVGLFQ
jgi:hypothetical protein